MVNLTVKKGYKKQAFEGRESYRKAWLVLVVLTNFLLLSQVNSQACSELRTEETSGKILDVEVVEYPTSGLNQSDDGLFHEIKA